MDSIASPKTKRWAYNMTRDEFVILIRRSQIHVREFKGQSSDRRNTERLRVLDPREDGSPRLGRSGMYYAWRPRHQNWSFPRHRVAHRCQGREMSIFFVFDVLLTYAHCVKKKTTTSSSKAPIGRKISTRTRRANCVRLASSEFRAGKHKLGLETVASRPCRVHAEPQVLNFMRLSLRHVTIFYYKCY